MKKIGLLLFLCGCGFNPNRIFVTNEDKNRIDSMLIKAQMHLDRQEIGDALRLAEEAYALNEKNVFAAKLLADVYLEEAGASILDLAQKLSSRLGGGNTKTKANEVLDELADAIELTLTDLEVMANKDSSDNPFFANLEVYEPINPGSVGDSNSPRYKVKSLRLINKAIDVLCPFVPASTTQDSTDSRHQCEKVETPNDFDAQVNLSFALTHLVEALVFNQVLNYQTGDLALVQSSSVNSNLFQRVNKLDKQTFTVAEISDYADAVLAVKRNIDNVFNLDANSMLTATMVDFRTAVAALTAIDGIPDEIAASLKQSFAKIEQVVEQAGETKGSLGAQTAAFKDQLNKTVVDKLNTSIESFIDNIEDVPDFSTTEKTEEITKVCDAYKEIIASTLESFSVPASCPSD